jgi:hypothetical protein
MVVKILPNESGSPSGKLADAEVHFTSGPLDGLRLLGFAVWERRNGPGRNVTFPARTYSVNGERRSFALLRPIGYGVEGQENMRRLVLDAYEEFERAAAAPVVVPAASVLAPGSGAAVAPVGAVDLFAAASALQSNARG